MALIWSGLDITTHSTANVIMPERQEFRYFHPLAKRECVVCGLRLL